MRSQRIIRLTALTLVAACLGCTSFRTTSLYRMANDSVRPQETNRKLKGLPVKLKVPSHLMVTIYEEQVILANSKTITAELKGAAEEKAIAAQTAQAALETVQSEPVRIEKQVTELSRRIDNLNKRLDGNLDEPTRKVLNKAAVAYATQREQAIAKHEEALKEQEKIPALVKALDDALAAKAIAEQKAAVGYTLISFTPPQFHVESELQYTDKVFLVDFRRPAGGILDLQGATMDDEQYFSEVKAEVTERTMEDIGAAMKTIEGVVPSLRRPANMQAVPVSAETPESEASTSVNFQKSVIATKRFDISECGWEQRMQDFISEHLGRPDLVGDQLPTLQPDDQPWQQLPHYGGNTLEQGLLTQVPPEDEAITLDSTNDDFLGDLVDVKVMQ